jgi:hypothetical protein
VYKVVLADEERTFYYLNPGTGALVQRADATNRMHRWLFGGLHRLDFTAWMRSRPLWDVIMLTLLLGGTLVTFTGCYLALRRIRSDVAVLLRPFTRARVSAPLQSGATQELSGRG